MQDRQAVTAAVADKTNTQQAGIVSAAVADKANAQ